MKSRDALGAFDNCPNRTTNEVVRNTYTLTRIACPKYPNGIDFLGENEFHGTHFRSRGALKIGCLGCRYSSIEYDAAKENELVERLHAEIAEACGSLYTSEHYSAATLRSFQIVKDRLRELTGFERGSEAFGKGGLYVNGSTAEHVDGDFQKGAQYLTMAIDMFRNEGSHTSLNTVSDPQQAYEFLVLSSLAMHILDGGMIEEG